MIKQVLKYIEHAKPKNKNILSTVQHFDDKGLSIYGIQFIFILIALLYASILFFDKGFPYQDVIFHFLRLKDVALEISHGQYPQFNFYTNMPIGNAINTFYPYLLLLPFAMLTLFFKGTTVISILLLVIVLIAEEICFYCFHYILHFSQFTSFLIAIFQWISSVTIFVLLIQTDYGMIESTIFFPLIFTGWIIWIEHNKWKMMTIGICGVTLSNLPMTLIVVSIIGILTILQWKRLTIYKIRKGIQAVIISLLILTIYWLPVIILKITNNIYFPNQINIKQWKRLEFIPRTPTNIFTPMGYSLWDLLELLAIILVIIEWKHINTFIKQITILSTILIFTNCKLFNISHFLNTHIPIKLIQSTQRFNLIAHFLLIIVLVSCLEILYTQVKHKQLFINIWYPEIIIYSCLLILIGLINTEMIYKRPIIPNYYNNITVRQAGESLKQTNNRTHYIYNHTTPTNLHTIVPSAQYPDYLPVDVLNNHIRNRMPYKVNHYYDNGMNFKIKHQEKILLPITTYHTQQYKITNNNHLIDYQNDKHYIRLKLHKGQNKIRVTAPIMWYRYIGIIISLVGISLLCIPSRNKKLRN